MSPELKQLLEWARTYVPTEAEKRAQIISFAYGNLKLSGCDVTLDGIEAEYDKLFSATTGLGRGEEKEKMG
jgi:hypothetical protein